MMVNRPVSTPTVYAGPVAGNGPAPAPVNVAVNSYQAPAVAGAQPGIMSVLGSLFSGIINFVKGLFSKLSGPANGPAPVVTTPTPTQPQTPATTGPDDATLAAQFGLAPDAANVAAFKQTLAAQQAEADVIGPGSANTEAVKELQQLLSGWGYQVPATGQFDPATADAVMQFKTATGLTEAFKFANGQPGVTPFIDNRTRAKMLELLQANQAPAQPTAPAPTPGTTATPAPVTPAPSTPAPTTGALTAEEAALASQFGINPTKANFDAFMAEAGKLEQEANVVGPKLNEAPEAVQELQTILAQWGYAVTVTGQFDAATVAAVNKFKRDNGISYNFQMADGSAGVHPYIDARTKDVMIKKLGG